MLRRTILAVLVGILSSSLAIAQQYYAVLITGDTPEGYAQSPKTYNGGGVYSGFDEFWNDTFLMWKLLHDNGFPDGNIYTLYGHGNDYYSPNPNYQPGSPITKFSANIADVQNMFSWLANGNSAHNIPKMTNNDVLFIWTFDHGTTNGNNVSALCLMDGVMWDYDFASYVNQIACQKRIILMQQCYGGGFIDNLQSSKTVMLTACSGSEVAYRADDFSPDGSDPVENELYNGIAYHHGEYDYHVINALCGKTIVGNPISSDADGNGGVSSLECKTWEFNRDSYFASGVVHPQYSDQGNIGPASFVYRLMDLAYANKSISSQSTAFNMQRKFYRESSGKLHEVFASGTISGGEIFYRNSTDNGASWSNTKRLSDGTATSLAPCITMGPGSAVIVVWQQANGSNYNVVFSRSVNGGTSWSGISTIQSIFSCASPGPLPSVSDNIYTGSVVVVYRTSSGLKYAYSTNNMSSWSSPSTIPNTNGDYNSPTTALYPVASPMADKCNLAFSTYVGYSSQLYYSYYWFQGSSWSSFTNLSGVLPYSYAEHKDPSLAVSSNSSTTVHVAWEATLMGPPTPVLVHRKGSSGNFGSQYTVIQYQSAYNPSITGLTSDDAWMVFQNSWSGGFHKMQYYNSGGSWIWGSPTYVSSGNYAQLSVGSSNAKYLWTAGTNSPYTIAIGSETLNRSVPLAVNYSRELNFIDTGTGSSISLEMKQPQIVNKDGTISQIAFVDVPPDSAVIGTKEVLNYGNTQSFAASTDSDTLKIAYAIRTTKSVDILQGTNAALSFDLYDANTGSVIKGIDRRAIVKSSDATSELYQVNIPASSIDNLLRGNGISIRPSIVGLAEGSPDMIASLGHVYRYGMEGASQLPKAVLAEETVPKEYLLEQNYPNPFNPSTQIRYSLRDAGKVSLVIYDVLGREIANLADGYQQAGRYTVTWNSTQNSGVLVSSGVYFARLRVTNDIGGVKFTKTIRLLLMK